MDRASRPGRYGAVAEIHGADGRVHRRYITLFRGLEPITHTDFVTGCKYMEWTDAVTMSLRERRAVTLPL